MFKGNAGLRSAGEYVEYTDDYIKEIIRCKEDIIYFAEKYFYIVTIDEGKRLIELFDYQKKMLKAFIETPDYVDKNGERETKRHCIVKIARQAGKTTVSTIYLLWYCLFHKDKTVAILANKETTAIEILDRIKLALRHIPLWMQVGIKDDGWNRKSVALENGTKMIARATSPDSISGETISLLYMDEFAKVKNHVAEEFITATYPVISSGKTSKIIIVSCVADDTYIFTDNGINQISDFIDYNKLSNPNLGYMVDDYNICGMNGLHKGNVVVNNGEAITNIITSPSSKLECSEKHKIYACKNGLYDWYESSELNVGDFICIKYGMNLWGNNDNICFDKKYKHQSNNQHNITTITEDFAYFLGLYLSEGYARYAIRNGKVVGGQVIITCGDDLSNFFDNLGFKYSCKDGLHYIISSKYLTDLLVYLGFDINVKAPTKKIPKRLFQMSKKNIISMIQGIMDGDGSSQKNRGTVSIQLSSKILVEQLRILFLNFGILSTYNECIIKKTKLVKVESQGFRIELNSTMSKIYYDIIGFRFKRKQNNKKYLSEHITRDSYDIIPYSKNIIFDLKNRDKESYLKISPMLQGRHNKNDHMSRMYMLREKEIFLSVDDKILNNLYENISDQLKWEPITQIIKSKNKVYDFALPDVENDEWCHSIIYNGVVGHQTPLGMNHFYEFWMRAIRGQSNFYPIKIAWDEHPSRDEEWKEDMIKDIGPLRFGQEFQCCLENTDIKLRNINTGEESVVNIGELYNSEQYK